VSRDPILFLLSVLLLALPVGAQPRVNGVRLEGPADALEAFHDALRRGDARVYVYGASHTAPDVFTGELRRRLQRRYGDGGGGWVIPAQPFPFYDHDRARFEGAGWIGRMVRYREQRRDAYGLAGIALDAREGAWARVRPRGEHDRIGVHYLRQPGGGRITLRVGAETTAIETAAARRAPDVLELFLEGPAHEIHLRAEGRVRLFGVTAERSEGGVVVDAFGVPGARFVDQRPWDENTLRTQLERRPPDLVAFAYGTNESAQARVAIEDYRAGLSRGLERWRRLAPGASCLLIGPGEWPRERSDGSWGPRRRTNQIISIQREEATRAGCAFFDTFAMMGGEGSMVRWVETGLALDDHVHFTDEGYRRMGAALHAALTRGL